MLTVYSFASRLHRVLVCPRAHERAMRDSLVVEVRSIHVLIVYVLTVLDRDERRTHRSQC
jgi:hypothetical protein